MRRVLIGVVVFVGFVWANNTSLFFGVDPGVKPGLLAHRGVHQRFAGGVPDDETCTAAPVLSTDHGFIENTLPSMAAAFAFGAKIVELDVHLTPDGVFAVFHDWRLECRTDGEGQTNHQPFETLRSLDVGYGYSPDGQTYPLRGTGVGAMPRLEEVFEAFPEGQFLVNFKSDRRSEGRALVALLDQNAQWKGQVWAVYGGRKPSQEVAGALGIPAFDKSAVRDCMLRYVLLGWSGHLPALCRTSVVVIPQNVAPWLWGWPTRFEQRMRRVGTEVILVGPYAPKGHVRGIDTLDAVAQVPQGFGGFIWTNAIEVVGPAAQQD